MIFDRLDGNISVHFPPWLGNWGYYRASRHQPYAGAFFDVISRGRGGTPTPFAFSPSPGLPECDPATSRNPHAYRRTRQNRCAPYRKQ